eukprot:5955892-Amphidinium_carterae.1
MFYCDALACVANINVCLPDAHSVNGLYAEFWAALQDPRQDIGRSSLSELCSARALFSDGLTLLGWSTEGPRR